MLEDTVSALAMLLETVFSRVLWALMPVPAMLKTLDRDMVALLTRHAAR